MSNQALEQLAERAGIAIEWTDANNRPQRVSPEVLRKVLTALGYPASTDEDVAASVKNAQEQADSHELAPLLTADYGQPLSLQRWLPAGAACTVLLEDGATLELRLDSQGALPGMLPVGYQQVRVEGQHFTVAVAPARCYGVADALEAAAPRAWGIGVQLYSLRRPHDGGFGDTQALEALVRAAGERGADAVAISPMHAMFSSDTTRYSPYSPSSRLFLNSLYAAPGTVLGERALRAAIERANLESTFTELENLELVDWPKAAEAKLRLLRTLHEDFGQGEHPMQEDFASFRHRGGEALADHCCFEALQAECARRGEPQDWRQWPPAWRDPRSAEVAQFAQAHAQEIEFYAFGQWLIARSLERAQDAARASGMRIGLIADLAVGADGAGSQAWSRQDELLAALTVGAPPDILNRSGQSWGISAFSPEGLKRHGFRAFIEMLRANFAHAGGLRIDHVLGLNRLWVIPQGEKPTEGAYLHYPLDDLLRLLALESYRHKAIVLGEDLGTVPDGLREKLAARDILGMRVLLFEQYHSGAFKPLLEWPDNALATTSTHDLPPLKGWWRTNEIDWNRRLELIDEKTEREWRQTRVAEKNGLEHILKQDPQNFADEHHEHDIADHIIDASVRFIGHTRAPLVLLPIEDALGLVEQPNLPGTIDEHPNWRRRLTGTGAALLDQPDPARRLELLAVARRQAHERDR
ncbi:4-alpha-glucanotransferase [Pseudomonas sp. RIT-PI-S]|uniref:4-alpha-glucanotransferase n=1 Tax=Pseudomonas sp. RIT-PI-S TaxID=3035295 RepID=UPI0021D9FEE3|nr:4-alpha-glucanotransferase [Pseudomonas sp. RIT-PI-S]